MTAPSISDRLSAALEARGWQREANPRTKKFVVYRPGESVLTPVVTKAARYFLGRSGALRYDALGRVSESTPHEHMKARLLDEADKLAVKVSA